MNGTIPSTLNPDPCDSRCIDFGIVHHYGESVEPLTEDPTFAYVLEAERICIHPEDADEYEENNQDEQNEGDDDGGSGGTPFSEQEYTMFADLFFAEYGYYPRTWAEFQEFIARIIEEGGVNLDF